jgi:hypothetical protein
MRSRICLLPVLSFLVGAAVSQQPPASEKRPRPALLDAIQANLLGAWTGNLQYRDYQSDELVTLPTWLEVTRTPEGGSLEFRYLYDDGPSKLAHEVSRVTLDLEKNTFSVASQDGKDSDVYQLSGADRLSAAGLGTLTMTGSGVENDKKVEVRITLRLGRNEYHYLRETRLPGQAFQMRDAYNFTRRDPPLGAAQSR